MNATIVASIREFLYHSLDYTQSIIFCCILSLRFLNVDCNVAVFLLHILTGKLIFFGCIIS